MLKNPYIVSWVPGRMKLSDGATSKEFQDHDEAMAFLEDEMKKVAFPIATEESKAVYRQKKGKEPEQGQIECTRLKRGIVYLYGVSERYIIPEEVKKVVFGV